MGDHKIRCWQCDARLSLVELEDCDGICPACNAEVSLYDYLGEAMDKVAALESENAKLREALERTATWIENLPVPTVGAAGQLVRIDKALAAAPSAPKADDPVKVQLLEALETTLAQCLAWQGEPDDEWSCQIHVSVVKQARAAIAAARQEGGKV